VTANVVVRVRATSDEVRRALAALPAAACGGAARDGILLRVGTALLGRIKAAFVAKARGGADDAGEQWEPLDPSTVAYGRAGRTRAERQRAGRPSQALTTRQQERWWEVYRRQLARFEGNKGRAAAVAWLVLKGEGATTLFDKYAGRHVEVLRDTGVLFNSLSAGVEGGAAAVGTNVPYAKYHHRGVPGRLPQRRLWPESRRWPESWWRDLREQANQGLLDLAIQILRRSSSK
jgi:phage gpG-like protein